MSKARAESLVDYLVEASIDDSRFTVEAFGETRPIASNATVAGRLQNRPIERFGEALSTYAVANADAERLGHTYPYALAQAGGYGWVTMLDDDLSAGGVYLFDSNRDHVRGVTLSDKAEPARLQAYGEHMLLIDSEADTVHARSLAGQIIGRRSSTTASGSA